MASTNDLGLNVQELKQERTVEDHPTSIHVHVWALFAALLGFLVTLPFA